MKKIFFTTLLLVIIYLFILYKPSLFFYKTISCKYVDIKTDLNIESSVCYELDEMIDKIKPSKKLSLLILSDFLYFILSTGSNKDVYLNILSGDVLVKGSLKLKDLDFRKEFFEKLYSSKLLLDFPLLSYLSIPKWKIKGYARYIFSEPDRFSERDICYEDKKNEDGYYDFENRVVVSYLVDVKRYSEKSILSENMLYKFYLDEAKTYYCQKRY